LNNIFYSVSTIDISCILPVRPKFCRYMIWLYKWTDLQQQIIGKNEGKIDLSAYMQNH